MTGIEARLHEHRLSEHGGAFARWLLGKLKAKNWTWYVPWGYGRKSGWLPTHDEIMAAASLEPEPGFDESVYDDTVCGRCLWFPATEEHFCPYGQELGNGEQTCTCCPACATECAMDV